MLYCMVVAEELEARKEGLRVIINIRKKLSEGEKKEAESEGKKKGKKKGKGKGKGGKAKEKKQEKVTQLSKAKFNFDANKWWKLVDIELDGVQECPMTLQYSLEELEEALENELPLEGIIKSFPSHSQSVERAVKLVTEASAHVFGFEQRHRHINTVVMSRSARPAFESKSRYKENYDTALGLC